MKTLLAVFFCCCLVGPLGAVVTADWGSLLPESDPAVNEETLETVFFETLRTQADDALMRLTAETLDDTIYEVEAIRSEWTGGVDGNLYISGVTAYVKADQMIYSGEISRRLSVALGVTVAVFPLTE